ncbi:MAG: T9SS type A sorting domain-containing protein [Flavobacteriales bacterium]|nr:T9SS type A sorting domain-containing protein [Flavobacteriales bacterium]MBK6946045.1 T9SS type A sorting domain-containing protein [Flavobacteriales bacterium]MBK7239015.1 T9SS type A sorting domain-containing protein [Flavobacteriales bacterium]MBK7296807.1 T9SS type A sorting domain-containing protein [Flavobacteriales bacterium]HQV53695.1 T9SS type A sorting domain-containing protein [Flavobacteriales bacterium]
MRYVLLFVFSIALGSVSAQQVDWLTSEPIAYTMNPGLPDQVLTSAPGYLVGMRQASIEFVYGQHAYGTVMLEALDPSTGAPIWSCFLFDSVTVSASVVSDDGLAYFAGSYIGNLGLCEGSTLSGVPGQDIWNENHFLVAVDLNTGFIQWARNISLAHEQAIDNASLAIDPNGDLWYTFSEWGQAKVIRVDALLDDVEVRVIDGVREVGTISFDPWGGLYVSGSCDDGPFAFGGQIHPFVTGSGYRMFVLRYKPDGTAGFAEFASDITFQNPTVVADRTSHAYIAGAVFDTTSWGGIPLNGADWVYATFLAKLDSTGQFLWAVESDPPGGGIAGDMDRSKGPCVAVDANDYPYLFGNVRGMVDWGNGVVSNGLTLGAQSLSVVSFAPDGLPQWAATSNPTGFFHSAQTITALAETDAVHFAGHIQGEFMFTPHTTGAASTQSAMVGRIGGLSTSVQEPLNAGVLVAWPNPVSEVLNVELNELRPVRADLFNSAGQRVRSVVLRSGRNAIDVSEFPAGVYLLRLADGVAVRVAVE